MKTSINKVLQQIRVLFIPYLVILLACLCIKLIFTREEIYFTVNSWHFSFGDAIFPLITDLGDGLTVVIISLIAIFFNFRKGFLLATSYALTSIVAQCLKFMFAMPRPAIYFKDQLSRIHFVDGVELLETHSFPSGHTVSAFSAAVVFTYLTPKKYWGPIFLLVAILIGYSRMYLSEHFFEDVTAGSAVGVFITIFWLSWIDSRSFIHSKKWDQGVLSLLKRK